jgi:SnoaL-like domain
MPWFPDFVSAVELARRQIQVAGHADPVAEYFSVLQSGATRELEKVWPGEVVIYDPRAGEVRGHRQLRRFVRDSQSLWAEHHASVKKVASTSVGRRAVVELLVNVRDFEGREVAWPIAVVAESPDDLSVVFRTYCSQWPVDGSRHLRPPILESGEAQAGDVVGRFLADMEAGDAEGILSNFEADGYLREPIGPHSTHRGTVELGSYFAECFGAGGGVHLEHCALTDDGTRCALEYNCVRWGSRDLPPQAGIGVYERSREGLLRAVRMYDDIQAPAPHL